MWMVEGNNCVIIAKPEEGCERCNVNNALRQVQNRKTLFFVYFLTHLGYYLVYPDAEKLISSDIRSCSFILAHFYSKTNLFKL